MGNMEGENLRYPQDVQGGNFGQRAIITEAEQAAAMDLLEKGTRDALDANGNVIPDTELGIYNQPPTGDLIKEDDEPIGEHNIDIPN
jgi:hypothetical protein